MILLIDNYDSFSYNLFQLVGELYPEIKVVRNDELTVDELKVLQPKGIILSPGPGRPEDAGITQQAAGQIDDIPILGVCLGHQAICAAHGATVTYAKQLMHGKQSDVEFDTENCALFKDLPKIAPVARYHSLAAAPATLPNTLKVTAKTIDGEVMAVQHKTRPIFGVQFHPESIMTPDGKTMLKNFIDYIQEYAGGKTK